MSDTVIHVENLSKRYVIGHQRGKGDGLRHAVEAAVRNPLQWLRNKKQAVLDEHEEFWALKDVSFEVKQGEVVGIIGRNGAGKSTLLKILSRITEPTSGKIRIKGRVASLLEVGTGFHPELTGRENIFLNGAILGMHRAEIKKKFDEIVAFAEIEKFLDTPVKRYSSGMYVRLAFAVAAHLEPEILIIDEVLAVGDAEFQKKCLGKMQDVSKGGRTVLFVSHNIQTVRQLCTKGVLMENGRLCINGDTSAAITRYLGNERDSASEIKISDYPRNTTSHIARFLMIRYSSSKGQPARVCDRSAEIFVEVTLELESKASEFDFAMAVTHAEGTRVFSESWSDCSKKPNLDKGIHCVSFVIPACFLKVGSYSLALCAISKNRILDFVDSLPLPEIVDQSADEHLESQRWGVARIPIKWQGLQ